MPLLLLTGAFVALDLYLLYSLGGYLGLLPTVALVLGMGWLGWRVLRMEGVRALARVARLGAGAAPAAPDDVRAALSDGAAVAVAGLFLLMPGVLSDVIALALLWPVTRGAVWAVLTGFAPRTRMVHVSPSPSDRAPPAFGPAGGLGAFGGGLGEPFGPGGPRLRGSAPRVRVVVVSSGVGTPVIIDEGPRAPRHVDLEVIDDEPPSRPR